MGGGRMNFESPPRLLLWATFLITLSVLPAECRRCYWCGPLADQVHRSRRAMPCAERGNQMTACEPGLNHCAVVATSPPHVESRFCVKLYQDNCYPLFCNSTRTWKMTCPCRGDLCNGANSERELEAFDVLRKLSARTFRLKKRSIDGDESDKVIALTENPETETKEHNAEPERSEENKETSRENCQNTETEAADGGTAVETDDQFANHDDIKTGDAVESTAQASSFKEEIDGVVKPDNRAIPDPSDYNQPDDSGKQLDEPNQGIQNTESPDQKLESTILIKDYYLTTEPNLRVEGLTSSETGNQIEALQHEEVTQKQETLQEDKVSVVSTQSTIVEKITTVRRTSSVQLPEPKSTKSLKSGTCTIMLSKAGMFVIFSYVFF